MSIIMYLKMHFAASRKHFTGSLRLRLRRAATLALTHRHGDRISPFSSVQWRVQGGGFPKVENVSG